MSPSDAALWSVDAATRRRPVRSLWRATASELRLVFTRRRNWLLLLGLVAIPLLIGLVVYFYGGAGHGGDTLVDRITGSGLFLAIMAFVVSIPLFFPLTTSVVAGDAIAGEAQSGALRYLLTAPISRSRLLFVKAVGVLAFIVVSVLAMCAVSLIAGVVLFGAHDLALLSGDSVSWVNGFARVLGAAAYVALSLTGLGAVGLFISSLTEVPLAAMAATAIVSVVSTVLDQLPQLDAIRPGLLTHHWLDFIEFMRLQVDFGALWSGLGVQLAWVLIFGSLAWARTVTRDVTC